MKSWDDVELSSVFQSMSPKDKSLAKVNYFREVIEPNDNYLNLSTEEKIEAQDEFFGGRVTKPITQDEVDYRESIAKHPYLSAPFVGVGKAARSAVDTAKVVGRGTANTMMNAGLVPGVVPGTRELPPVELAPDAKKGSSDWWYQQVGRTAVAVPALVGATALGGGGLIPAVVAGGGIGGLEAKGRDENVALGVATGAAGMAGLHFASKLGATIVPSALRSLIKSRTLRLAEAEKIGSIAGQTVAGAIPGLVAGDKDEAFSGALFGGTLAAKMPAAKRWKIDPNQGKKLASVVINELVKPSVKRFSYGKDPGRGVSREIAETGETPNSFGELGDFVYRRKNEVGKLISKKASSSENQNKKSDLSGITAPYDRAIATAVEGGPNNQALVTRLTNERNALIRDYSVEELTGEIRVTGDKDLSNMSPAEVFKLKKKIGENTKWTGNPSDDMLVNAANKQAYQIAKEKLNQQVPELRDLNERYGDLTSADIAIRHRENLTKAHSKLGLYDRLSALVGYAVGGHNIVGAVGGVAINKAMASTAVKTRVAKWLYGAPPSEKRAMFTEVPGFYKALLKAFSGKDRAEVLRNMHPNDVQRAVRENPQLLLEAQNAGVIDVQGRVVSSETEGGKTINQGSPYPKITDQSKSVRGEGFEMYKETPEIQAQIQPGASQAQNMMREKWGGLGEEGSLRVGKDKENPNQPTPVKGETGTPTEGKTNILNEKGSANFEKEYKIKDEDWSKDGNWDVLHLNGVYYRIMPDKGGYSVLRNNFGKFENDNTWGEKIKFFKDKQGAKEYIINNAEKIGARPADVNNESIYQPKFTKDEVEKYFSNTSNLRKAYMSVWAKYGKGFNPDTVKWAQNAILGKSKNVDKKGLSDFLDSLAEDGGVNKSKVIDELLGLYEPISREERISLLNKASQDFSEGIAKAKDSISEPESEFSKITKGMVENKEIKSSWDEEPLAKVSNDKYTVEIIPGQTGRPGDFLIYKKGNPEPVQAGHWMDQPESFYPKNYKNLSINERAKIEADNQLKRYADHEFKYQWLKSNHPEIHQSIGDKHKWIHTSKEFRDELYNTFEKYYPKEKYGGALGTDSLEKELNSNISKDPDIYKKMSNKEIESEFERNFPEEQPGSLDVEEMRQVLIAESNKLKQNKNFPHNEKGSLYLGKDKIPPEIPKLKRNLHHEMAAARGEIGDYDGNSFWITPNGKLIKVGYSHAEDIQKNPKKYNFSKEDFIKAAKSRTEIDDYAMQKGFIRVYHHYKTDELAINAKMTKKEDIQKIISLIEKNSGFKKYFIENMEQAEVGEGFNGTYKQVITFLKAKLQNGQGPSDIAKWHLPMALLAANVADKAQAGETKTLGQKNNNPINLKAFEKWDGMSGKDSQGHAVFESLDHGIRAGLKNLKNHQRKNPNQTLTQYLNSFAEENGTEEAKFIAKSLNIQPNSKLKDISMERVLIPMAQFESKTKLTAKDILRVKMKFKI